MAKIISFSGIDGCGKTTIINQIRKTLSQQGKPTSYTWLRFNHYLTKSLLAFCRLTRLTKYENINGVRVGYHEFHRSKIISYLFIFLTYIDTLTATILTVYIPAIFSDNLIVCDRWVFDIMVDLEIDTRISFSPQSLPAKFFKKLLPRSAVCFLIKRDFPAVKDVRMDHALDRNFPRRFELFERLAEDPRLTIIDNNGSITTGAKQVLSILERLLT